MPPEIIELHPLVLRLTGTLVVSVAVFLLIRQTVRRLVRRIVHQMVGLAQRHNDARLDIMQQHVNSVSKSLIPVKNQLNELTQLQHDTAQSNSLLSDETIIELRQRIQNLRSDLDQMSEERSMQRAINMAQQGENAEDIRKRTGLSRAEARALIRFQSHHRPH